MDSNESASTICEHEVFLHLSDPEVARTHLVTPIEELFFTWILPVVLLICLLGNSAFIFTVIRVKSMRTVTNNYLLHVSISDIIFVSLAVIAYMYSSLKSPVRNDVAYRSFVGCMIVFHQIYTMYFASLLLITFVTTERYYAICKPLQHRSIAGKSRTKKIIATSWVVGVFLGACAAPRYSGFIPQCVQWPDSKEFQHLPTTIYYCYISHPNTVLPSEILQASSLFLALFINIFMYSRIIQALGHRPTLSPKSDDIANEVQQRQSQRVRNQVARLLVINGTLFFLCQTPFRFTNLQNIVLYLTGSGIFNTQQYGSLLVIGRCLVFVNSCANPFVYVTTSSFYRDAFLQAIGCRAVKSKHSRTSTISDKTQYVYVK